MKNSLCNRIVALLLWLSMLCIPGITRASVELDGWRAGVIAAKNLAENDVPRAYKEAQRLQTETPANATPADKARMLNLLARIEIYAAQVEAAASHSQQALEIANQNGDRVGQAEAYLNISLNSVNQANIDSLIDAAPRAMEVLQGVDRPDLLGEAMLRVAMMYRRIGQMDESVTLCMQAMDIAKRSNDQMAQLYAAQCLGISFVLSDRHADARVYYTQMRDLAKTVQAKQLEAEAIEGIATSMDSKDDWRTAVTLQHEANALYRSVGAPFNIGRGLFSLATNLRQHGLLDESLNSLGEALAIYERYPNKIGMWWTLNARSENYQAMGRLAPARADAERAYTLAKNIGLLLYRSESAKRMAAVNAAMGDHKRAYQFSTEAEDLTDKISRKNTSARMIELAQRYQNESKQKKIDELSLHEQQRVLERRWLLAILGGSFILLAGGAYFMLRLRHSRNEIRLLNNSLEQRVQARTDELQQQTQDLRDSRQLLTEAQRIAHVGSWELNLVDNILIWSDEIYRIFEVDPQRFGASYEVFMHTVHPDDRELVDISYKASLAKRERFEFEYRLLLPDGRIKYVFECCESYYDDNGKPLRSLGTVQDITERKLMEKSLIDSEREFRSLTENLPDNITRWDVEGRYLYINPVHEHTLGVSAKNMLGKPVPDTHNHVKAAITQVVSTGQPVLFVRQLIIVNGETQIHDVNLVPERDAAGKVVAVLGIGRDMTYLYRLQDDLKAREQQLRALAESSPGMMGAFYARPDGSICMTYVSANIEELFGLRPQDVATDAAPLLALNHPDDAQRIKDTIAESARTMTVWHQEYRIMHPTKGLRWMESNTKPEPHPDGGIVWYGYVHDITERKEVDQTRSKLARALKLLSESNRLLVHAKTEQKLLEDACRFTVEIGGYRMAWIGFAENDEHKTVRPVAQSGYEDGYLDSINVTWADTERGQGPIGIAIRTRKAVVNQDWQSNPMIALWREAAIKRGYRSSVALPLVDNGQVLGIFVMYSVESHAFGSEEVALLQELADDLALGIGILRTRAEKEQTEAELKLKEFLIDNAHDAIYLMDREGFVYVNDAVCRSLGYSRDELLALTLKDIDPAFSIESEEMQALMKEAFAGSSANHESRHYRRDGSSFPVEIHTSVIDYQGKKLGLSVVRDITERKLAERKLKEALEFSEGIINAIPDLLFEMDGNGKYLNVWTHTPELLAAQKVILLGNTVHEVLSPESAAVAMESLREAEKNDSSFGKLIRIDLPQGSSWFELSVSKKSGSSQTEDTYLVLSRDVTVRQQMEIDLWDSRDFLNTVIDSVSDPIFVKDRQHRWTLLNEAFCNFIGHARETLLGKSDYDFFPEIQANEFWAKDEFVFNAGVINLNEERFTSARGETHYVQTKKTPFVSGDGQPMLVGVIRDITDYKRYEEAREAALAEAMRLAKTRSEFLSHMSHELRTPLNGILGYTQILQRDNTLSSRNADALNVIRQSGEHLLSLVEDILDLARIEAGRFKLDLSDISLATFLHVIVDIVSIRAKQKGLEFITDSAADLPAGIRGDDKRLRQVLLNLLSNAVKFTEHGKVIFHISRTSASRIAFVIEDTGVGIAASELETVFHPFEQSGDVPQRLGGTGLGLTISRQLVRLMGGEISVESLIGKGSTFRFELELPAVEIDLAGLLPLPNGKEKAEATVAEDKSELLIIPSADEMKNLHHLALLGNMRDIVQYAEQLSAINPRYQPFAVRLRRMAEGFQSKAILTFVEGYLHDTQK